MTSEQLTRPNILLIIFDSVRAANTSIYGHDNDTTPFLKSFSQDATVYTQARAPGTESISSHTSIFTGLAVREHNITNRHQRLSPGNTIWEKISEEGYETGVFSNNPFLTELPVGLRDVFDVVVGRREEQPFPAAVNPKNFVIDTKDRGLQKYIDFLRSSIENGRLLRSLVNGLSFKFGSRFDELLPSVLNPNSSAHLYTDRFIEWQDRQDGPWAACVNFMDAHYPYSPGEHDKWGGPQIADIQREIDDQAWEFIAGDRLWGERRAIEALYDGSIRSMDDAFRRIIETLRDKGELDNTLVVVTADHGEGFGEQSRVRNDARVVGHGNGGIHESVLHVPLVVKHPEQTNGKTHHCITSLTQFPTAVWDALADEVRRDSFLPNKDFIVCSTNGVDPDTADRAMNYCDSLSPYNIGADAVYTDSEEGVIKNIRWGDQSARLVIKNAQASWVAPSETVEFDVIDKLVDANVKSSSHETVSSDVSKRLEQLGYA